MYLDNLIALIDSKFEPYNSKTVARRACTNENRPLQKSEFFADMGRFGTLEYFLEFFNLNRSIGI